MLIYEDDTGTCRKEKIIKITDGKREYYGGNQAWFSDKVLEKVGCSIVAAANLIAYKAFVEKEDKLFNYSDTSKENFLKLMNEIAQYLEPNEKLGTISALYFIYRIKEFFKSKNVKVNEEWITTEESFEKIENFIKRALAKDKPVILLMLKNVKLREFDWHWMTITKIFNCNDIIYVYISTWGEKRILRLYDLYLYSYYGSLICF